MQGHPMSNVPARTGSSAGIGSCPDMLHVLGRSTARENGDVCGEYHHVGTHLCHAVYQKVGSKLTIRYWPPMRRWVIDREGIRESAVCVAYAEDNVGSMHPAHTDLVWQVWESGAQAHVPDGGIIALDAPRTIAFVGRGADRENANANGEYDITGVCHGRPLYRHRLNGAILRYHAPEDRWLLSAAADTGNVCSAYADGNRTPHPGFPCLEWHIYETQGRAFVPDPSARTVTAPGFVHVVGRAAQAENSRICGTYRLMGVHEDRPVYVQPSTHAFIRYSSSGDRWLIVCDGHEEPTLLSKMYQWILKADTSTLYDRCSAFAEAHGTTDPGHSRLEWHIWESQAERHCPDPWVRVTTAPLALTVSGRDPARENSDIAGEYMLAGTHLGRPAYQKAGTRFVIRYWPPMNRWLIDRAGLRSSEVCVAYADGPADQGRAGGDEHPAVSGLIWNVFETNRGSHFPDPNVRVSVPAGAPVELPSEAEKIARAARKRTFPTLDTSDKRRKCDSVPGAAAADPSTVPVPPTATPTAATVRNGRRWFGIFGG